MNEELLTTLQLLYDNGVRFTCIPGSPAAEWMEQREAQREHGRVGIVDPTASSMEPLYSSAIPRKVRTKAEREAIGSQPDFPPLSPYRSPTWRRIMRKYARIIKAKPFPRPGEPDE